MQSLVQVIVSCLKRDKPLLGPMITMIHGEIFRHYDSEDEHDDVSVTVVQASLVLSIYHWRGRSQAWPAVPITKSVQFDSHDSTFKWRNT